MSAYEKQRLANIAKNKKLLEELGLNKPFFEPVEKPRKPQATAKKRKIEQIEDKDSPRKKSSRTSDASSDHENSTLRRSTRNRGKAIDYSAEIVSEDYIPDSFKVGIRVTKNTGPLGREDGKRVHNPKKFGAIPGIEVGTWWESRQGCSADSIHAPWVAGISGGPEGAYSVALSGGYDDDVDDGYALPLLMLPLTVRILDLLRTAPQSSDQSFEHSFNASLKKSAETKKPVRVIRGFKSTSNYAPTEGYRYDGLYTVESAWMQKGLNPKGYLVCKYLFKRVPDQPPIPVRMSGDD
ncbi:PUA-like domain-containing protein [Lentinula novae-zelandiae]|nr:PUA-like domain-containing protein [Lentinula novae-zelandiae]